MSNGRIYQLGVGNTDTHSRCLTVGAAGFLLGGGIGFNMQAMASRAACGGGIFGHRLRRASALTDA